MIERLRGERPGWRRLLPFALLATLGLAGVLPSTAAIPGNGTAVELANPDRAAADAFSAALAAVPQNGSVLIDVDADLGTYPEIRYATRAALADALGRNLSLAFVSFSPEGRALAAAELARLRRDGVPPHRLLDLGYTARAEAGLVLSVTSLVPDEATGSFADALRARGGGIDAFDLVLVVGGGDMGPRSWIEQVETRLPTLSVVAIAPTFLRPELEPYLRSGQLRALLATVRDDVAYGATVEAAAGPGQPVPPERAPNALAMLVGMLIALAVLIQADARRMLAAVRHGWDRAAG
jgi:hypothetical protein